MTDLSLMGPNDNPGGATDIQLALVGLARLLAKAEAKRVANSNHAPENVTPEKGKVK